MAIELSTTGSQILAPNASIIFSVSPVPASRGLVYSRPNSGLIRLASPSIIGGCGCIDPWTCCGMLMADYEVGFHANLQLPTGGTTGDPISLAIFVDGEEDPDSLMQVTPAAVEQPFNVGAGIIVPVPWICRCSTVSVRNVSTQNVEVLNPNLIIEYDGLSRRR